MNGMCAEAERRVRFRHWFEFAPGCILKASVALDIMPPRFALGSAGSSFGRLKIGWKEWDNGWN